MLTLHNTLTGKKEEFKPIKPGEASLYHCGPTVYNFAHIGNLRAYVFADILRRTLEQGGYHVRQVMNITDIGHLTSDADEGEDKMVTALKREGKPLTLEAMKEVSLFHETAFKSDLRALNIKIPDEMPRASEHIAESIELIQKLESKGSSYRTNEGIYFDTARFPSYGTRGGFRLGELKDGARVASGPAKKNPRDFALWKFAKGKIGFESPWGRGFPGWHIECSAMSRRYLGQPFDIHTGGIDHIPVHHQNEMAQSEAAYGVPLANYWLHNEHLILPSGKMAKSGDGFVTLQNLRERGIHPLAYRYLLLQTHYRAPLDFSFEAAEGAERAYLKFLLAFARLHDSGRTSAKIAEIMSGDLNTPAALAGLWEFLKKGEREEILAADRFLGLDVETQARRLAEEIKAIPAAIKRKAALRGAARRSKDFSLADALREEIRAAGFEIRDTGSDSIVRKLIS